VKQLPHQLRAEREAWSYHDFFSLVAAEEIAPLLGPEHARAILDWETMHAALLRVGAVVAVAAGGFIVFAVATGRRRELVIH
jgi:elongation factor P--beta-lysine ligase